MRIVSVTAKNFGGATAVQSLTFELSGVILLTGPNGSGKSRIALDAPAWALWGETARGESPVSDDVETTVSLTIRVGPAHDEVTVTRRRKGRGRTRLDVSGQAGPMGFQTATEAQVWIDQHVGSWSWGRTAILSPTVPRLGQVSRTDRMKLLGMLAVDVDWDRAARANNRDIREFRSRVDRADGELRAAAAALDGIADVAVPPPPDPEAQAKRSERSEVLKRELSEAEGAQRLVLELAADRRAALRQAEAAARHFQDRTCPTCGQAVTAHKVDELRAAVDAVELVDDEVVERARTAVSAAREALQRLREEDQAHQYAQRAYADALARQEGQEALRERWEDAIGAAESTRYANQRRLDEAEMVAAALKPTGGLRAMLLGRLAESVSSAANYWLDRLSRDDDPLCVTVRIDDSALDIDVTGAAPEPRSYGVCSTGQQRRIDTALAVAQCEIAEARSGQPPGVILVDEAFDGLDADSGIPSCAEVIRELAADRCILVITHNPALLSALRPLAVRHVEFGA